MTRARTYLDHNATSPLRPDAKAAVVDALDATGNPSSVHAEGWRARAIVETARTRVAALVGARADDVVLTSGGTEANSTALRPGALRCPVGRPVRRLLIGATEHRSALDGHRFPAEHVAVIPVDGRGLIDRDRLRSELATSHEATLVSVQAANSETGVVQPLPEIVAVAGEAGAVIHVDAVQALGRVLLDVSASGLDAVSLSSHKLGGPMGAGALVFGQGRAGPFASLLAGGGQQRGLRSGTENVSGIAGFGAACEAASRGQDDERARVLALRDAAADRLRQMVPDVVVFGSGAPRLPNTLLFAVPGLKAETALMALDLAGIAVSSGSACSSGKVGRSHVLAAMGVPAELAAGAVRVSFGWTSTDEDVARFAEAFASVLQRLYDRRTPRAA